MTRGAKIITLYEYSQTGVIVRGVKGRPGWHVVRFDDTGRCMCIHADMMAVRNA